MQKRLAGISSVVAAVMFLAGCTSSTGPSAVSSKAEKPFSSSISAFSETAQATEAVSDRILSRDLDDGSYDEYEYDEEGHLLQVTSHLPDGPVYAWDSYAYDEAGQLSKCVFSIAENRPTGFVYALYEYGPDQKVAKASYYFAETGTFYYSKIPEYDAEGQLIKESRYNDSGTFGSWMEYSYDAQGKKVQSAEYSTELGKLSETNFAYDEYGRLATEHDCLIDQGTIIAETTYTYHYEID